MINLAKNINNEVLSCLYSIYQNENVAAQKYLHFSFMVRGPQRPQLQGWLRSLARENTEHAIIIGEKITSMGGHPPIYSSALEHEHKHTIRAIIQDALETEKLNLEAYEQLEKMAGKDIALVELARHFISKETEHIEELLKMATPNDR